MEQDEFFIAGATPDVWGTPSETLNRALVDSLLRGPVAERRDFETAECLVDLVHDQLRGFGTDGVGLRVDNNEARVLLRAMTTVLSRIRITDVRFPFRDLDTFRTYWIKQGAAGTGGYQARREILRELFQPLEDRLGTLRSSGHSESLAPVFAVLDNPAAILDGVERAHRSLDADPRLAVGMAKEMVESTCKLVLDKLTVPHGKADDATQLAVRVHQSLGLHAKSLDQQLENIQGLRSVLGGLNSISQGIAELRNAAGTGHGPAELPAWLQPRHARLAVGAASVWIRFILETLEVRLAHMDSEPGA
ncbi:abortive infection family protein [Nocardioides jejuensis]|nr:abortive infection family protein [Nocardioides jejuensis]